MQELFLALATVMAISFFCSLCEAVLYSVPYSYVELLASKGNRSGRLLRAMRENISKPVSAILTLDTLGDTVGSAFVGALAVSVLGGGWLPFFSAIYAAGILFFSKVVPKTLGVRYARGLARPLVWPLEILTWILWPVTVASELLTRWMGQSKDRRISVEELQLMARLGRKSGVLRSMEEVVIKNILSLRNVTARQIMTPRTVVFALCKDLSLKEAKEASPLWPWPHSRVPLHQGELDSIVGLVHRRDVLVALAEGAEEKLLSDFLRPVHMVPEMASADILLQQFIERREHLFVVVDEFGGVAGVVTLEDVLESILGQEIVDESDLSVDLQKEARQRGKSILEGPKSNRGGS
ncbi:MAG: hemolysin family protein [bacterium]